MSDPDGRLADFARFAHVLYGDQTGFLCVVAGRRQDGRLLALDAAYVPYPAGLANAWRWLLRRSDAGKETYVCAHLLTDRRRVKENAAPIVCLWADGDTAPIPTGELAPTMVVATSPGRWHGYWRLSRAIDPATAEQLNRRLSCAIGADDSGWDLGQLLRPPGTANHKYPDQPQTRLLDPLTELSPESEP